MKRSLLICALLLSGCAANQVHPDAGQIVTRDVYLPVRAPCPDEKDIPTPPKTVHEEHPVMPEAKDKTAIDQLLGAAAARERILAAKVMEDRTYIEIAAGIIARCARPDPAPAATPIH